MQYLIAALFNPLFLINLLISVGFCFHIVRSGQNTFWLWIVLMFPGLGWLVYLAVVILPGVFGGKTARTLSKSAREALDPTREYREAAKAAETTPTVANQMRLAAAAAAQGKHAEAESLYRKAVVLKVLPVPVGLDDLQHGLHFGRGLGDFGVHADDPTLKLGRARALIELGRPADALEVLQSLAAQGDEGKTPQAILATARALSALGRTAEADTHFQWASARMPGFEAIARYTAFLAEAGRMSDAKEQLVEIDSRIERLSGPFRKEAQGWRDLAAAKIR